MKKVITYGSFDLFHTGHHNILKRAKDLGDYLIVGVTSDHYDQSRGKINVYEPLLARIENVRRSGFADEIIVEEHEGQKIADIQKYGIDTFTVGSDWRGVFDYLQEYCKVVYLERTKDVSSTQLREIKRGIVHMGIVGSGRIASRFVPETKYVSGVSVSAIYNPRLESANNFAACFEIGFSTDNFSAFLGKVDAVYVAAPHETHYAYVKQALISGKHVLCEKPLALKEGEAKELFALAEEQDVILMEAVKTAYAPGFLQVLTLAKNGRIGAIRDVEACFTKLLPPGAHRELQPGTGGSFTELASYPLLPVIKLLGCEYQQLRFSCLRNEDGADLYAKAHFTYDNAFATIKVGLGVKSEGQLLISGTRGYILVESPWWLTKAIEVCYEDRTKNERFVSRFEGQGLRYEIAAFTKQIWDRDVNFYQLQPRESLRLASVMEQFLSWRDKL